MLRRTGFKRKTYEPAPVIYTPPARWIEPVRVSGATVAAPKENVISSRPYRMLVAAMSCRCCGMKGCQAAHANYGKGMAIKTDDRTCFALCPKCHFELDQGGTYPKAVRREKELEWGAETRRHIVLAGLWPKNLPMWGGA